MTTACVRRGAALALLACSALAADPVDPAKPASADAKAPAAAPSPVGLDSLLKLPPNGAAPEQPRAGGGTRQEWEERFATARGDVAAAQQAIAQAQQELAKLTQGGEAWQMSAPGTQAAAGAETSPVSFRLRQELRRQRDELAAAERRLTELEVEANLAGVPADWTRPAAAAAPAEKPAKDH